MSREKKNRCALDVYTYTEKERERREMKEEGILPWYTFELYCYYSYYYEYSAANYQDMAIKFFKIKLRWFESSKKKDFNRHIIFKIL